MAAVRIKTYVMSILWALIGQDVLLKSHEVSRSVTHLNCRDNEALVAVEGFYQLHVVFWQGKVKHLQVLLDPGGCHTFRDTHDTPLHMPPVKGTPKGRCQRVQVWLCAWLTWLTTPELTGCVSLTWVWSGQVFSGISERWRPAGGPVADSVHQERPRVCPRCPEDCRLSHKLTLTWGRGICAVTETMGMKFDRSDFKENKVLTMC